MKTVAIVQARMGSTRLPGKVMRPIGGTPMIALLLERLGAARRVDEIMLATSTETGDDDLAAYVAGAGFIVFRGSETDVLDRYYRAALLAGATTVVRITGDCPLADPALIDGVIDRYCACGAAYVSNVAPPTYPDGLDVEVFSFAALESAWREATSAHDREHVTPFIRESGRFSVENVRNIEDHSGRRWTVDRPQDLEVVSRVFQYFQPRRDFAWGEVLELQEAHPEWFAANRDLRRNEGSIRALTAEASESSMSRTVELKRSHEFASRIHDLIPGGSHTYTKGDDQFPANAPVAIVRGHGARVWDPDGREFIDCSMGLTSVSIGHGYAPVADAVCATARQGTNFQRPAYLELEAAERFLATVDSGDMVKFAKNGSTVTTAAVKLARAFTGRNRVAICSDHNFFSYDDWFIVTTPCDRGIPDDTRLLTAGFRYNDLASVEALFSRPDHDIACLIMEPVKFDVPKDGFLEGVAKCCRDHGVVFVLDEMISGFKWGMKGAQGYFGVRPDLATWGKGVANGFSCCALTGRADIMELGGIRREGDAKLFLISTTHGAETTGLAAMLASVDAFEREGMIDSNWQRGADLHRRLQEAITRHGLTDYLEVKGYPCLLAAVCRNRSGNPDDAYRTLLMQEMIARGVLFQGLFYTTWSHQQAELDQQVHAFEEACGVYAKAIDAGSCEGWLTGPPVRPVFRRRI